MTELILPVAEQVGTAPLTWDMAKEMMQYQQFLTTIAVVAVLAVIGALAGYSWYRGVFLHKRELEDIKGTIMESLKSDLTEWQKKNFEALLENVKTETQKAVDDLDRRTSKNLIAFDRERSRLSAVVSSQAGFPDQAAVWWARVAEKTADISKSDPRIRVALKSLEAELEKCDKLEVEDRDIIRKHLSSLPTILSEEIVRIQKKLDKLPTG